MSQIQFISQQLEDIRVMFKIRDASPEEKKKIFMDLGFFRTAVLMNLYWHMDHTDLLDMESRLNSRYMSLVDVSELTDTLKK